MAFVQQQKKTQDGDIAVDKPPSDSVSALAMNGNQSVAPTALIATSWDCSVSCYELQAQQAVSFGAPGMIAICRGSIRHDAPALCCDFASDNTTALSGGCDGQLRQWNVTQGPQATSVVGRHDQPIRCLKFLPGHNVVVTGGWDKQIKVWDLRTPGTAAMSVPMSERVYAMDCKADYVVVGLAHNANQTVNTPDKNIAVLDLRSRQMLAEYKSPLTYQTRCISMFQNGQGFAIGCIEGRVAIEYFNEMQYKNSNTPKPGASNFVFKCHRDKQDIYAVNAIDFHHSNTFVTAGSDGSLHTWDKDVRSKLASFDKFQRQIPIADAKFSPNGKYMAYALSYDWSKGSDHSQQYQGKSNIMIHEMQPAEINPKPKPR